MKVSTTLNNRMGSHTCKTYTHGYIDLKNHQGINVKHNLLTVNTDHTHTCVDMLETFGNIDFMCIKPYTDGNLFGYNCIMINGDETRNGFLADLRLDDLNRVDRIVVLNMSINKITIRKTTLYNAILINSYIEHTYHMGDLKMTMKPTIVNTENKYIKRYNKLYFKADKLHTSKKWQSQN